MLRKLASAVALSASAIAIASCTTPAAAPDKIGRAHV
jgi:hypothetical protein